MTEFKIGDKVKILTESVDSVYLHVFKQGDEGTVWVIDSEGDYHVSVPNKGSQMLHASELELVNE